MQTKKKAIFYAILAAALYALNAPISKLLLAEIPSTMMAGLLYLGTGIGMHILEKFNKNKVELPLTKKELPYTAAMVILDIAAPIDQLELGPFQYKNSRNTIICLINYE